MWDLVSFHLHLRKCWLIHLDEGQELGGRGSEIEKAAVINALKSLMQIPDWPTNLVISGTPELHDLLMQDPQLSRRLFVVHFLPVADYTGCDPQMLANGTLDASNPHRLQLGADRRNRVQCCPHSFRFCPACLEGLADGDLRTACLGRTDWLVDANHVCVGHGIRLVTISPHNTARVHRDLSPMIPRLLAAQAMPWQAGQPTRLERYLAERLDGAHTERWIDGVQLDVAVHTAEVFGVMAMRGPKADWKGISSEERREHGHVGAEVLVEGPAAIKDFLRQHVGRGRLGNDYHNAFGRAFNEFYFRKDQPAYRPSARFWQNMSARHSASPARRRFSA